MITFMCNYIANSKTIMFALFAITLDESVVPISKRI